MIKEVKCKNCGHYHLVSYHSGRFWFDGMWRKGIEYCEFCGEEPKEIDMFYG
jgi:hypothetical protein